MAMLRESQIMKIHYITGIAALFVVAVHIMMRLIMPFNISLEYENVIANYHRSWRCVLQVPKNLCGLAVEAFTKDHVGRNWFRPPIAFHAACAVHVARSARSRRFF